MDDYEDQQRQQQQQPGLTTLLQNRYKKVSSHG